MMDLLTDIRFIIAVIICMCVIAVVLGICLYLRYRRDNEASPIGGGLSVEIGNAQIIGTREKQDDSFATSIMPYGVMAIVADGIGGYINGNLASKIAVETYLDEFERRNATDNISYCTSGMYTNALVTAGLEDAEVKVTGPFKISGTSALVGAMKAYSVMTGKEISEDTMDAATNELVATANLAEAVGDSDKAEQLIAAAKEKVLSQRLTKREDIKKAIESSAKELGIEVPEDEVDKLVTMMQKVSKVDVNVDALKKQAGEIYNKLKDAGIDLSNVDTKGLAQKIGDFFANIFEAIVRFFSGLFG